MLKNHIVAIIAAVAGGACGSLTIVATQGILDVDARLDAIDNLRNGVRDDLSSFDIRLKEVESGELGDVNLKVGSLETSGSGGVQINYAGTGKRAVVLYGTKGKALVNVYPQGSKDASFILSSDRGVYAQD